MGRARKNAVVEYDLTVHQAQYDALLAQAQEQGTTPEEILRAELLSSPDLKERLVPRARKMLRHATIRIKVEGGNPGSMSLPSLEPGLDD